MKLEEIFPKGEKFVNIGGEKVEAIPIGKPQIIIVPSLHIHEHSLQIKLKDLQNKKGPEYYEVNAYVLGEPSMFKIVDSDLQKVDLFKGSGSIERNFLPVSFYRITNNQ